MTVVAERLLRGGIHHSLAIRQRGIARRGFLQHLVAQSPHLHELQRLLGGNLVSPTSRIRGVHQS